MSDPICCVCHQPAGPYPKTLGGRYYCPEHYARVTQDRRGLWQAGAVQIAGLLLFVGIVELIASVARPQLEGAPLVAVGILLAIVPALLWLAFFYQQDRLEPEPKGFVLGVFVLGALLAMAVGIPLSENLYRTADWLGHSTAVNVLGAILVIGFSSEFLKYAAVRYSIYSLAEFDERVDGIIYSTAAGLGYATALNVQYIIENGGVDLQAGVIRIVVTAMAQASFAGLVGYFLGRNKFEHRPVWWLPAGVSLAAILNGLFVYVRGEVSRGDINLSTGGGHSPWPGLWLALGVAVVVFAVLNVLIRRANRATLAETTGGAE